MRKKLLNRLLYLNHCVDIIRFNLKKIGIIANLFALHKRFRLDY